MQQLDEESAMLKRGLEMVDMARDWYLRQLAAVQDKQRMLGKVNYNVSAALRNASRFVTTFPCRYCWTGFGHSTRLLAEKFLLNG